METYFAAQKSIPPSGRQKHTSRICQGARLNKVTGFSSGFSSQFQRGSNLLMISIGSHAASFLKVQGKKKNYFSLSHRLNHQQGHRKIHFLHLLVFYRIDWGSKSDISILLAGLEISWAHGKKDSLRCLIRVE